MAARVLHLGAFTCCSVWMTWLIMVIATVSSVIAQLKDRYYKRNTKVLSAMFGLIGGGFQANIVQFGLDQLHHASTTEITSFIIWYVWTLSSAFIVVDFNHSCLNEQYKLFIHLFTCTNLTLAVVLLLWCKY